MHPLALLLGESEQLQTASAARAPPVVADSDAGGSRGAADCGDRRLDRGGGLCARRRVLAQKSVQLAAELPRRGAAAVQQQQRGVVLLGGESGVG